MKRIPLSNSHLTTLVDDDVFDLLSGFRWHLTKGGYASRSGLSVNGKTTTLLLHRLVVNTPAGMDTDHIDRDKLNNARSNLRVVTRNQNNMNMGRTWKKKGSKYGSVFKGVAFHVHSGLWMARVKHLGKWVWVKYFKTEIDAAHAYDTAARKYFGEFACLNFPDQS